MDGARADDDLTGADVLAVGRDDPDGAATVEGHPVDEHVAADDEVRTVPGRLEVGVVGRHAMAVADGQGDAAEAERAGRVVVVADGVAEGGERVAHRPVERPELAEGRAGEGDRATSAVEPVTAEVDVVLEPRGTG